MYFKIFRCSEAYFTYLLFLFEPPLQKIAAVNSNVSNYQQEDQLSSPYNSVIYQRLIFSETLIVTVLFPFQPTVIFRHFKYTLKPDPLHDVSGFPLSQRCCCTRFSQRRGAGFVSTVAVAESAESNRALPDSTPI